MREQQTQGEDSFHNAIEYFDSLEHRPILRGLPDASNERMTVSRLDKWVTNRLGNKLWKDDPLYRELKDDLGTLIGKMTRLSEELQKLQTDDEKTVASIESDAFLERLRSIPNDLRNLSEKSGIDFSREILRFTNLADRFQRVRNVQEIASLTQVDQVKLELGHIATFRDHLVEIEYLFDVEALDFQPADADHFKQSVWSRNISQWARGEKVDELDRAMSLFDWTVRNIDLRPEQVQSPSTGEVFTAPPQEPWQTLILGHGTSMDRAWVFIELLRQQRIDAVLLGIDDQVNPGNTLIWAVGVLHENELYLFLPAYGLAVPGPDGLELGLPQPLNEDAFASADQPPAASTGEIVYKNIATLSQVLENDQLLRQLDLPGRPFPVTAEQCRNSTALIVCSPSTASQRMSLVQNELSGAESMVLYQSYRDIAERLSKVANIKTTKHWLRPIQAMYEREVAPQRIDMMMRPFHMQHPKTRVFALWAGRVLYFKGVLQGEESAITYFRDASVSDREIEELKKLSKDNIDRRLYSTPEAVAAEVQAMQEKGKSLDVNYHMTEETYILYLFAKRYARYWVGLACAENGKLSTAIEHLQREEIEPLNVTERLLAYPIAYNLGRCYEKVGRYEEAINRYSKYPQSPISIGNAIRVKWLKNLLSPAENAAEPQHEPEPEEETEAAKP